ncbi:hypothetical protein A8L45_03185 [Veronia pacifica]|uniref:Uncharacterized protein n=1 Tax=Veronia pacifica TaxID=1080227 RepID=A0A1C3EQY8_9GAMM|nr:hypothetical protein A8L45_03185 [Veronia pacifica]
MKVNPVDLRRQLTLKYGYSLEDNSERQKKFTIGFSECLLQVTKILNLQLTSMGQHHTENIQ